MSNVLCSIVWIGNCRGVRDAIKIKVAGGIGTYDQVISFIQAGAVRIGTSRAVEIVEGLKKAQ